MLSDLFLEKIAVDDKPKEDVEGESEERDEIDPGEQAIIGLSALSGNVLANRLQIGGQWLLGRTGFAGSTQVPVSPPISGMKTPSEYLSKHPSEYAKAQAGKGTKVFGGLIDYKPQTSTFMGSPIGPLEDIRINQTEALTSKIRESRDVVDSFIREKKLTEKGVRINITRGSASGRIGPHYNLASKRVVMPAYSKELMLHELGHAFDYNAPLGIGKGKSLGKVRKWVVPSLGRAALTALPMALVAGDEIAEALPGTLDDRAINFMQDNAPQIMGATLAATTLWPEAKASYYALQHIAKKEGPAAAKASLKKLAPLYGTYMLGAIPAIVGMALARKYMNEARKVKGEQRKEAGIIDKGMRTGKWLGNEVLAAVGETLFAARDKVHTFKQLGQSAANFAAEPGRTKRLVGAAKEIGTSPEFLFGAVSSAVPAAAAATYLYATKPGEVARRKLDDQTLEGFAPTSGMKHSEEQSWREENPLLFASLVGLGAAMSGGILTKYFSDLSRVA